MRTFPKNHGADFITITGDLVDFFQGVSPDSRMIQNQVKQFTPILKNSKVPVYMTLGNHDIASNVVANGDYDGLKFYAHSARAVWTRSVDCFKDGTYYSEVQQVGSTTYRLIFLDDGYYAKSPPNEQGDFYFENEQLDWLEWQLTQSPTDVEIIFMHVPFSANRKRGTGSQQLYDLLINHDSAKLILAGHKHTNEVNSFQSGKKGFTQVLTGAFARDPKNWRMVELTESGITISQPGSRAKEITISN